MKQTIRLLALLSFFAAPMAHADQQAGDNCAAALQPGARLVFNAVTAKPQPAVALDTVLEARVRELVFTDRLTVRAARPAAEAASACLRMVRNCGDGKC